MEVIHGVLDRHLRNQDLWYLPAIPDCTADGMPGAGIDAAVLFVVSNSASMARFEARLLTRATASVQARMLLPRTRPDKPSLVRRVILTRGTGRVHHIGNRRRRRLVRQRS